MIYFKTKNPNGSIGFGHCEKYPPVDSEIITLEEYELLVSEFEENNQSEPLYTLDEAAAIIASEVASDE